MGAAVYQWCEFKSSRGKNQRLSAERSNSNTVGFNFQTFPIDCKQAISRALISVFESTSASDKP